MDHNKLAHVTKCKIIAAVRYTVYLEYHSMFKIARSIRLLKSLMKSIL